jgi:hypothetical protein
MWAVWCEPVSTEIFSIIREFNREKRIFWRFGLKFELRPGGAPVYFHTPFATIAATAMAQSGQTA